MKKPEFLAQALKSVVSNTVCPAEIVMVKDGALTEELEEVLCQFQMEYPIFKFVIHEKIQGWELPCETGFWLAVMNWWRAWIPILVVRRLRPLGKNAAQGI